MNHHFHHHHHHAMHLNQMHQHAMQHAQNQAMNQAMNQALRAQQDAAHTMELIDHLGIVAGFYHEIGLIEVIDQAVGASQRKVSCGAAVQAMVLNGLGFSSCRKEYGSILFLKQCF